MKVLLDWMTKQPAIFTDPVLISKSYVSEEVCP